MKLSILLLCAVLNLVAIAQSALETPSEKTNFETALIEKNNIRSLTVYAGFNEDEIEQLSDEALRIRMFEFNEDGYVVYHAENNKAVQSTLIEEAEKGIILKFYAYNDEKLKVYECLEDNRFLREYFYTFDKNQNLLETETKYDQEIFEKTTFKWKKGKLVKSKNVFPGDFDEYEKTTYNEHGKIIEWRSYGDKFIYEYHENGDTTTYIEKLYFDDTLASVFHFSNFGKSEFQLTYFLSLNELGDNEKEVFSKYDEHGNSKYYHFQDLEKRSLDGGEPKMNDPVVYEIKNEYDERGLLLKQVFYLKDTVGEKMIFDKVLHYKYEIKPLDFKIEKGSIKKEDSNIELR